MNKPKRIRKYASGTTLYLRGIPSDVHRVFHAHCVTRGVTMKQELLRLMQQAIDHGVLQHEGKQK